MNAWWYGNTLFDEAAADRAVTEVLRRHDKITISPLTNIGEHKMAFLTKNENGEIVAVKESSPISLAEIQDRIDYYTSLKNQYQTLAGAEAVPASQPEQPQAPQAEQPAQTIPATDNQGNVVDAGGQATTPSVDLTVQPAQAPQAPVQPPTPFDPNQITPQPVQGPQVFPQ